jgi:sugar (pentulose or hexulose) kinase
VQAAVSGKVKSWSSLSSYVLSRLTNRVQPMTYCEASTTGIFDREELQWHQGLLNILGVNLATLPTLCDVDELYTEGICAEYRKRWPELTKTAWARGIGEAAAFHIGVGCDAGSRRCIFVNMGTSAAVRVCVPCKDVRSGNEAQGGSHEAAKGGKPAEVPPGLWRSYIKRDLMLLSGTLNDGGSIYAWGLEQLAGLSLSLFLSVCACLPAYLPAWHIQKLCNIAALPKALKQGS